MSECAPEAISHAKCHCSTSSIMQIKNLLGDHFHPILVILAPLYWIYPHVEILLIAQAFLLVIPIVPIYLFVSKRLGSLLGFLFATSYMIFWGIQNTINYDFHEIAVAVPLIAFAIYFLDQYGGPKSQDSFWPKIRQNTTIRENSSHLLV